MAARVTQCKSCGRAFTTQKVVVDGEIAGRFYPTIAKLVESGDAKLTRSTAHRIGGSGRNVGRYRMATAIYAIEYCRIVRKYCNSASCVVVENPEHLPDRIRVQGATLEISDPRDGSLVESLTEVSGVISGALAGNDEMVWVLVRPAGDLYWVQEPASIDGGKWSTKARFGDAYTSSGHTFEVRAILAPSPAIRVAQRLKQLPHCSAVSPSLQVYFADRPAVTTG